MDGITARYGRQIEPVSTNEIAAAAAAVAGDCVKTSPIANSTTVVVRISIVGLVVVVFVVCRHGLMRLHGNELRNHFPHQLTIFFSFLTRTFQNANKTITNAKGLVKRFVDRRRRTSGAFAFVSGGGSFGWERKIVCFSFLALLIVVVVALAASAGAGAGVGVGILWLV